MLASTPRNSLARGSSASLLQRTRCRQPIARRPHSVRVAAMSWKPVQIYYFPIRGRAEVLKLLLAAKEVPFELVYQDGMLQQAKQDLEHFSFGQLPRVVDGDMDMTQSNAIIRHFARKLGLNGADEREAVAVDIVLEGVEALRLKYVALIYGDQLADAAKDAYFEKHISNGTKAGKNNGAHYAYLEGLLQRNGGGGGFVVGSSLSAADLALWEIVDLQLRIFADGFKAEHPLLTEHHKRIRQTPGIAKYLASPDCLPKVNNNNLG